MAFSLRPGVVYLVLLLPGLPACYLLPTEVEERTTPTQAAFPPPKRLLLPMPIARCLAFSPDGKFLASGHGHGMSGRVLLRDAITGKMNKELKVDFEVRQIAFSGDGKKVFVEGYSIMYQGSIPPITIRRDVVADLANGQASAGDFGANLNQLSISGDWRVTVPPETQPGTLRIEPLFGPSDKAVTMRVHDLPVECPALTSDGRKLAFVDEKSAIRIRDLVMQREVSRFASGHADVILKLRFTPDGGRLISASGSNFDKDATVLVWDLSRPGTNTSLPGLKGPFNRLEVSADGRYLAVGVRSVNESTDLTVWRLSDGTKLQTHTKLAWNTPVAFSPDCRRLAMVDGDGTIRMVSLVAEEAAK